MRVALTYSSAIDLTLAASAGGNLTATMPESVNLDFQTGVAADTLVFGSVRWAGWSEGHITDPNVGELVSWDEDVVTYTLGVGRKFSDSFSGALSASYEEAQGGTLFLDEIGDMPMPLQSKILHILQSGEFSPLGSDREHKSDAWVIAATNQDLEKKIKNRTFREDLFYRLNIINI